MSKLEIGKIVSTHGLRGEVKIVPWCDDAELFSTIGEVSMQEVNLKIEKARVHKNTVIVKFFGIDFIDGAQGLLGKVLYVEKSRLEPLDEGTYYIAELIGIKVFEADIFIGTVEDCFPTGSNDVYSVRRDDGTQLLIPAISEVVKKIDIKGQRMDVTLQAQ